MCTCDFIIAHGGIGDIRKHIGTAELQLRACNESQSQKLPDLFTGAKDTSVIRAEALCTEFIVEHNLPLTVSDHVAQLFRHMFPD